MTSSRDEDDDLGQPLDDRATFLDRLETEPDAGLPDNPDSLPPLSREEIDDLVEHVLDEELARLDGEGLPPGEGEG